MEKVEAGVPIRVGDADARRLGVGQRHFRLGHSLFAADAGVGLGAGQVQRLPVGFDGAIEDSLQRVLPAELEEELGEVGLLREALVFQVRGAHLGGVLVLAHRVADAAPQIRFPGHVDGQGELVDGGAAAGRSGNARIGLAGPHPGEGGVQRHGREQARTGLAHLGAGGHEVLEIDGDILVVDVQPGFERVQFGFAVHLPPFAFERRVLGLRRPPAGGFLEGRRSGIGRSHIPGPDVARGHQAQADGRRTEQAGHLGLFRGTARRGGHHAFFL
jgi:hypothetical protein